MIKINNLCKDFGALRVLDNISMEIEEGVVTGLAGPSGSGKTTLLRCIQGDIESHDRGTIDFHGKRGFMFQDFQLFPHMDILSNLTYSPRINFPDRILEHTKRADELLSMLGISHKKHDMPCMLSGGQKQRAALAVALMMQPDLLLCDEPTSGLDIATIDDVVALLVSVAENLSITIVIASHDLDFLAKIAKRVVLIKNGRIASDVIIAKEKDPIEKLKKFY